MLIFIACVFLTLLFCVKLAGQEQPPEWIIRGIAAVETGAHWNGPGEARLGKIGPDLGPWQMSVPVAKERGLSVNKIKTDIKYAERATVIHLTYLFLKLNDWREVAKAWRAGRNGRKKQYAIDYAERVENYGKYYK